MKIILFLAMTSTFILIVSTIEMLIDKKNQVYRIQKPNDLEDNNIILWSLFISSICWCLLI